MPLRYLSCILLATVHGAPAVGTSDGSPDAFYIPTGSAPETLPSPGGDYYTLSNGRSKKPDGTCEIS